MTIPLTIFPDLSRWRSLAEAAPQAEMLGRSQAEWRLLTRQELGLRTDQPIIATGHQTLLWHPGILAKYLAVSTVVSSEGLATANLVVDQHAEGFGDFEIPILRTDGALAVRRVELVRPRPRKDVPMGRHEAFTPPRPPHNLRAALPCIDAGIDRIFEAVYAHRQAANAALQMAGAIADMMRPWVPQMPDITSTDLIRTSLAGAIMREMRDDPQRCAECYNRAVSGLPEAGIAPLMIRDDYVELPLWRIRDDGRRMHAYDSDVARALEEWDPDSPARNRTRPADRKPPTIDLMPRALFMTALVRLGMCDLFVHGTGGANYDRAMERWIHDWLGVSPGAIAVASADVRLRLPHAGADPRDAVAASQLARRLWHDPESADRGPTSGTQGRAPGPAKQQALLLMSGYPRGSLQRRKAYVDLHEQLDRLREAHRAALAVASERAESLRRAAEDAKVATRRDWAFPVYEPAQLDELAEQINAQLRAAHLP